MKEIIIKESLKVIPLQVGGDPGTVQLVLSGYLDTYNSPEFQNHINSLINSGVKRIIFNCKGLNYISSTGIGAFASFLKNIKQKKGELALFGLQDRVKEVFQLLGFTNFFNIGEDFNQALEMIDKKPDEVKVENLVEKSVFPLIFKCPLCEKKLKAQKAGKFRCSGCKGVISIDSDGEVNPV